jgi:hypothetical protein
MKEIKVCALPFDKIITLKPKLNSRINDFIKTTKTSLDL